MLRAAWTARSRSALISISSPVRRLSIAPSILRSSTSLSVSQQRNMATSSVANSASEVQPEHTNQLAQSTSPYLLQHAHNPVNWYEWGPAAFAKARREGKPIFLSIGYSSCHWCHVMAHESFEDPEVAHELNSQFVSIKVDRETRPDVDQHYMAAALALNGSGGWPLSAFLTSDAEVIFAGTYFPKPTFLSILDRLGTLWNNESESVIESAKSIETQLAAISRQTPAVDEQLPRLSTIRDATSQILAQYDKHDGGFGSAPKFPSISLSHHVLHHYAALVRSRTLQARNEEVNEWSRAVPAYTAVEASAHTLVRMFRGGLTDVLGGGQARYSVTKDYAIPHWEKMLYDQGQNLGAYADAIRLASVPHPAAASTSSASQNLATLVLELRAAARAIVHYLATRMTQPGGTGNGTTYAAGGLYASEDADSLPPEPSAQKAKEGAFYLWNYQEVVQVLGQDSDAFHFAQSHWGLKPKGNIDPSTDPHGEMQGKNVLHATTSIDSTAESLGWDRERAIQALKEARTKLAVVQEQRPRPGLDDKIVTAWNGFAISGLAKASAILDAPMGESVIPTPGEKVTGIQALTMAEAALKFVMSNLYDSERGWLRRSWRHGQPGPWGFSIDYASLIAALLDLFDATGNESYVERAVDLQSTMDKLFFDSVAGGWFISPRTERPMESTEELRNADDARLGSVTLPRRKEDQDGAEPSTTSLGATNLVRLLSILDEQELVHQWHAKLDLTFRGSAKVLDRFPRALGTLASAYTYSRLPTLSVVVHGAKDDPSTGSMLEVVRKSPVALLAPILLIDPHNNTTLAKLNSLVASLREAPAPTAVQAHLCLGSTCGLPVGTVEAWQKQLDEF